MTTILLALLIGIAAVIVALRAWRAADQRKAERAWMNLAAHQPVASAQFNPEMVADVPPPAQRFLRFAIAPGTPLRTVATVSMEGEFSLGSKDRPNYMPMRAEQILAAPHGFIWLVHVGNKIWFAGSDGAEDGNSWSRFWLQNLVPVARAGRNIDHARAAFGRCVAEALFWTPAALLPGNHVHWEPIDDSTARVVMSQGQLEQAVDVSVDDEGRPVKVEFQRWSDANPEKTFRLQPFGGYLSEFQDFAGFSLPTRIEAGNFFGTDDYFPFFKANVTSVRFPDATSRSRFPRRL